MRETMRGITIELLTQYQSETYRLLDEVQLFVSLDGVLEAQLNGTKKQYYNHILIANNLDMIKICHAQALIKICIPMHFFSKHTADYYLGYFNQDSFTSHEHVVTLLKSMVYHQSKKQNIILIYDILKLLYDEAFVTTTSHYLPAINVSNRLLTDILQYTYDYLDHRISLKILSDNFFVSQSYISVLFTKYLDFSFKMFSTTLRLGLSLRPLMTTTDTIQNIAVQHGFSNYSSYSKLFKMYLGVSPADYRNQPEQPNNIVLIHPYDRDYFNEYLNQESTVKTSINISIDINDFQQPSYTPKRHLFLEISNCHIYDTVKQVAHQTNRTLVSMHMTLFFQTLSTENMKFTATSDLNHFCHLIKTNHCHFAFCLNNMMDFETFDKLFLQPLIRIMTAYPSIIEPEDLKLSIVFTSQSFNVHEIKFIQQRIHKYLSHCQFAIQLSSPVDTMNQPFLESFKNHDIQVDFCCVPFDTLIPSMSAHKKKVGFDHMLSTLKLPFSDCDIPFVLTGVSSQNLNHIWPSDMMSSPNQFLALLLQFPTNILGISIPLISTRQQPIAYFNSHGHHLPYSYMYQLYQCFAGKLNIEQAHYLLHETDEAYFMLLANPYVFGNNGSSYQQHYQITASDILTHQLVVTYTYDDRFSNVTRGITQEVETYYLPLQDIKHAHQAFQLQPHIAVHDFYNKVLHINLTRHQVKLIKIYKSQATKCQQMI